jgi:predicted dehydrogenase
MDIPRAYAGWDDLLADPEVQVVHNCTPTFLHAETNAAIIQAGKHVISDKPLCVTSEEALALLGRARAAGVVHAVTFNHRGFRAVHEMRRRISQGEIGPVHSIRGAYLQGWLADPSAGNWRVQETRLSGTLLDVGSHWFDLAEWVSGEVVGSLMGDLQQLQPWRGGAEGGSVLLRFAGGARGAATISQAFTGRGNRLTLEVYGARGALIWNSETPDSYVHLAGGGRSSELVFGSPEALERSPGLYSVSPARHPEGWLDAWRNLLAPIYARINAGSVLSDYPTFEAGLRVARILEAVHRSHVDERWTPVAAD